MPAYQLPFMKALWHPLLIGAALLLGGCGDKQTDPDPVPAPQPDPPSGDLVQVRVSNNLVFCPLRINVSDGPVRTTPPFFTSVVDLDHAVKVYRVAFLGRPRHLHCSMMFYQIEHPDFIRPRGRESITAEVLVGGVVKGTVVLDANSFNDPANYWRPDPQHTHVLKEVELDI